MRQIADAAGMQNSSLYHHFSSKQQIYVEAHHAPLERVARLIEQAIESLADPWQRLEEACCMHLMLHLAPDSVTMPMMSDQTAMQSEMRPQIVGDRDEFEQIYKRLIADLQLSSDLNCGVFRVCLVSLINSVPSWYRPDGLTPREIGKQIVAIFRGSFGETLKQSLDRGGNTASTKSPSLLEFRAS
jgi:AcrR family transcriptional regulator